MQKLSLDNDHYIAYHAFKGKKNKPGVVFMGGFMSDMQGTKATALEAFCMEKGYSFVRFDYFGHGQSSGTFVEGTIGQWKENCLEVIDQLTEGPQILVGSSMGGWLMLLSACERKSRIAGIVGIASAPDFTENLIWKEFTDEQKQHVLKNGQYLLSSEYGDAPYPITRALIEDGRQHLVLNRPLEFDFPVRLIHGQQDCDVPYSLSQDLAKHIHSPDLQLQLIQDGDHRMSTPEIIAILCSTLEDLVETRPQNL